MSLKLDLVAARALIDTPEKWRKDSSVAKGSRCAAIACSQVVKGVRSRMSSRIDNMWSALFAALPPAAQRTGVSDDQHGLVIGDYNDDPATTHADVLSLFDRAIAAAGDA